MVKRYYELNEKLKELQEERDLLNKQIKNQMLESNISKAIVGKYLLEIGTQDRSKYDDSIVAYLKEIGMTDLIVETYDEKKLKERCKSGKLSNEKLNEYKNENIIHILNVNLSNAAILPKTKNKK